MTADGFTFLDFPRIRFGVAATTRTDRDGSTWDDHGIEGFAYAPDLRRVVTASDIVSMFEQFSLNSGTWDVGRELRVGWCRNLTRDPEYVAVPMTICRAPFPAGERGSSVFTEQTAHRDGTSTIRELIRWCGPDRFMVYMETTDCICGSGGVIRTRVTSTIEREPNNSYGHRRRESRTVAGDI